MKKILVLLDVMVFYDREIFRGIKAGVHCRSEDVSIYISSEEHIDKLKEDCWDYIIADGDKLVDTPSVMRVARKGLIYSSYQLDSIPAGISTLVVDNQQIAITALGKFTELGIQRVGFYSNEFDRQYKWSKEREEGFKATADKIGLEMCLVDPPHLVVSNEKVGVLCSTDRSARTLIQALTDEKIMVPKQVNVIGVDCDPIESEISPVAITSVDISPFDIGKQAVSLVLKEEKAQAYFYTPSQLVEKASCSSEDLSDGIVSRASFYIYNNYHNSIKVSDVANYCRVSRKTLDSRFFNAKNITVHQYIHERRLEKCMRLLSETDESIEDIALQCGYPHQSYLYQVFKKHLSCTPLDFRKKENSRYHI
ncbi:AraC family transcriptional regulator [Vibrio cyclitrophicus]|uniref:AraC family transcriptional regulator n=1 Tax=Vibrio cyclitrophicus TaxID=47951 RepID=UPI0011B41E96|nr:helix-turn-helix domain-containing protein [Vibrio cyclitrophicus]